MSGTLYDAWNQVLANRPDAPVLIEGETGRVWTRSELDDSARAWIVSAKTAGLRKGQRVIMAEPNGARWFSVFLGLMKMEAIAVPVDSSDPSDGLLQTAQRLGAGFLWRNGSLENCTGRISRSRKSPLCLIKLTSGSMGIPKARLFKPAQMIADGRHVCASMGIRAEDINLGILPFGHSYGLGNLVMPLILQGTRVLCCTSPLPNVAARNCNQWKPTVFPAVPTLLDAFVRAEVDPSEFSSLRLVISAGAVLRPETAQSFAEKFGCRVHGFYGSSETGGITYDREGEASLCGRSVGTAMEGVNIVLSPNGRLRVSSAAVMGRGTWSPPDKARMNEFGEWVLQGRQGRTVKVAGRRLDLSEVEAALKALPGVRDAFVIAHPTKADALAAAAISSLSSVEAKTLLRTKLASWKVPERLLMLDAFPCTSRGKTDRVKLTDLIEKNSGKKL